MNEVKMEKRIWKVIHERQDFHYNFVDPARLI